MKWNIFLYNALVNRVPGIQGRYKKYRGEKKGVQRVCAWIYLIKLNVDYYIMRDEKLQVTEDTQFDDSIILPSCAESTIALEKDPHILVNDIEQYDVISFDVFDTLILRNMDKPVDVFYLLQNKYHYPNFKQLRIEAEQKARIERNKKNSDTEVTLYEIWNYLEVMTGINASEGAQAEFEAEKLVCYANPYFLRVVELLIKRGKKIIITSDMYLDVRQIEDILTYVGYPKFDCYFVSCCERKSKCEGDLYSYIKTVCGINNTYVHIGDNEYSDKINAEKNGFHSILYASVHNKGDKYRTQDLSPVVRSIYKGIVNGYLNNGLTERSMKYEFGFVYGGLFVLGFCQFIHNYAISHAIDKIFFLARDGEILIKAYKYLFPEESDKCDYVLWSRLASTKMCAHTYKNHYIQRMILHKVNQDYSFSEILHTMEIDDMMDALKAYTNGKIKADVKLSKSNANIFLEFVNHYWDEICDHYQQELAEGEKYYKNKIGSASRIAAIDVGWVGSGPLTLKHLIEQIWKFPCHVTGIVAGTCSSSSPDFETTEVEFATGNLVSYLFSSSINRDIWKLHDAVKGHNMIIELLLASTQMSFRGFIKNSFGEYAFNQKRENINSSEIQKGIMDFVKLYNNHPLNTVQISGRDAMAPILILYKNEHLMTKLLEESAINANIE